MLSLYVGSCTLLTDALDTLKGNYHSLIIEGFLNKVQRKSRNQDYVRILSTHQMLLDVDEGLYECFECSASLRSELYHRFTDPTQITNDELEESLAQLKQLEDTYLNCADTFVNVSKRIDSIIDEASSDNRNTLESLKNAYFGMSYKFDLVKDIFDLADYAVRKGGDNDETN
jgi:hypothetical protein